MGLLFGPEGQADVRPRDRSGRGGTCRAVVGAEPGQHVQAPFHLVVGFQAEHRAEHGLAVIVLVGQDPAHQFFAEPVGADRVQQSGAVVH